MDPVQENTVSPVSVAAAAPALAPARVRTAGDPREANARPSVSRFVALATQLALLELVFNVYHTLDTQTYLKMTAIAFGAFAIHYWLPFRLKEPFWAAASALAAFALLPRNTAILLIGITLGLYAILRSRFSFRARVAAVAAVFLVMGWGCAKELPHVPRPLYAVFGAIFMFRIVIYIYDLSHSKKPAGFVAYLTYFLTLPNYVFTLFPTIDFETMRRGYYRRDGNEIAQQGIDWMIRGTIQLMLYQLVVYINDPLLPDRIRSFPSVMLLMVSIYLLYLKVSGQFHIIVGLLHLFGYDLPETHHRYFLASSISDLWRRINIYWKDFMVKIVYFPVYFRLRKRGDTAARVAATGAVIAATWMLHSYQYFWVKGAFFFSWPDAIFWSVLGVFMIGDTIREGRRKVRRPEDTLSARATHAAQVCGTFALMCLMWTLWSAPTVGQFLFEMTHWAKG